MSALDGKVKRRLGRPCEKGWRNAGAVCLPLGADLESALEEYDPKPQNKTKTLRGLIEIGLAAVSIGAPQR